MALKNPTITRELVEKIFIQMVEDLNKIPTRNYFLKNNGVKGLYKSSFSLLYSNYNELITSCGYVPLRATTVKGSITNSCKYCNSIIITNNSANKQFCNSSCSASFNNPKRSKPAKVCKNCGGAHTGTTDCCSYRCRIENRVKNTTVGEAITKGENQQKFSNIRSMARNYCKYLPSKSKCQNCGYDKHVEIAHIKGITQFEYSDLLWEVNNENNLLALCPNCHWEFDHNVLALSTIKSSKNYDL